MNFESLTILPGTNKAGEPEHFAPVTLHPGELCAIAGNTGAGKSRLIKDIEQLVNGDGISRRGILINNVPVTLQTAPASRRNSSPISPRACASSWISASGNF